MNEQYRIDQGICIKYSNGCTYEFGCEKGKGKFIEHASTCSDYIPMSFIAPQIKLLQDSENDN